MIIINDTHLGASRKAGTTLPSQVALKEFVFNEFEQLVNKSDFIVINGDLYDSFTVETSDVIRACKVLSSYLAEETSRRLVLVMGNHDASAKGDKVSSFHLTSFFLGQQFPDQVQVIDHNHGLTMIKHDERVWAIPHMLNQSLFDLEIEKAAAMKVGRAVSDDAPGVYLLLHCNVESPFAEHSDHSLNLNHDQIDNLLCAGWTVVVGHEHQQRFVRGKRVIIPGNQIPTSVADCLHNPANKKQFVLLQEQDGVLGWTLEDALDLNDIFAEIDWRKLGEYQADNLKFIRVSGDCSAEEAADMVNVVAKFRQCHDAFVITNAVKVEGVAQMEALAEMSMENVSKFNVLGALLEELNEREQEVVKGLLA